MAKPKTKKIDILGVPYDFVVTNEVDDLRLDNSNGYCDYSIKKIVVAERIIGGDLTDPSVPLKRVRRHELLHAFLYESGSFEDALNEDLIEYWAIQIPKLIKIFEQAEAL